METMVSRQIIELPMHAFHIRSIVNPATRLTAATGDTVSSGFNRVLKLLIPKRSKSFELLFKKCLVNTFPSARFLPKMRQLVRSGNGLAILLWMVGHLLLRKSPKTRNEVDGANASSALRPVWDIPK